MSSTGKKTSLCHDNNPSRPNVGKKLNFDQRLEPNLKTCHSRPGTSVKKVDSLSKTKHDFFTKNKHNLSVKNKSDSPVKNISDWHVKNKQECLLSKNKPEDLFSKSKQENLFAKTKKEDLFSNSKQEDVFSKSKKEDLFSKSIQDELFSKSKQGNLFAKKKNEDFFSKSKQEDLLSKSKQEDLFSKSVQENLFAKTKKKNSFVKSKQEDLFSKRKQEESFSRRKQENLLAENKKRFVSEWLRKHKDDFFEPDNLVFPSSPILRSSFTKRSPKSPIVGNSSKRPRQNFCQESDSEENLNSEKSLNDAKTPNKVNSSNEENLNNKPNLNNKKDKQLDDICSTTKQDFPLLSPANQFRQRKSRVQESEEKNLESFLSASPSSSYVHRSPVIEGKMLARKLEIKSLSRKNNETLKKYSRISENRTRVPRKRKLSMTIADQRSPIIEDETFFEESFKESLHIKESLDETQFICSPFKLKQELEFKIQREASPINNLVVAEKDHERIKESELEIMLTFSDQRSIKIEDETFFEESFNESLLSLKKKDKESYDLDATQKIYSPYKFRETEVDDGAMEKSARKVEENDSSFIDDGTVSDETPSYVIEDIDTEDIYLKDAKKEIIKENEQICETPDRDSEDTFFSKAGSQQPQAIQPSQKISQISSTKINNLSEVNNIISEETSSSKPIEESFGNILNSEKKKRKFKNGRLAGKVLSLVESKKSDLRIWLHRANQPTFENFNYQFVELCIQKLYNSYSKQFAECYLISDKYNLLKTIYKSGTEENGESLDVNSKLMINRTLTIMIVPEIAELKAEIGYTLKVFFPWEVLDRENVILSVRFFLVNKKVNLEMLDKKPFEESKSGKTEKFDCPCIQEGNVVEDCTLRFVNKKPNVIKQIFNSL